MTDTACIENANPAFFKSIDLHTHSISSGHGSTDTITDMAKTASARGMQLLGISEHGPATAGSVKASYFRSLKLAEKHRFHIRLLYGVELNIMDMRGTVDLEDEIIAGLDYAIISIHPPTWTPYEHSDLTDAYIHAMNHPGVTFLGHIDDARFPVDFERLLKTAKEKGIYPEINNGSLMPEAYRKGGVENCRRILKICRTLDLPVLLSSDSHGCKNVGNMQYIFPLLKECDFPNRLVINDNPAFLWKILEKNKKGYQK